MAKKSKTDQVLADAAAHAASRDYHKEAKALLRKGTVTVTEIAKALDLPESLAKALVTDIQHGGHNVVASGERITITNEMPPAHINGAHTTLVSDEEGWITFGACGDTHLGSKYERLDVLNDLYDKFAEAGVEHVFHTGNWIDGEHPKAAPAHELVAHGMEGQLEYLASNYPMRPGITTYAVAGDDHEGWYQQREGVDIGRSAASVMKEFGRTDWVNMGYQAAHVMLKHGGTGAKNIMLVEHPGGGSSYADSYTVQKIVEALDGGEKPAVALIGHYHKLMAGNYRGVWYVQTGCTKDRDSFARKKRLRYVKGGAVVRLQLNGRGAVTRFAPELFQYFNIGYYQHLHGLKPTKAKVQTTA